MPVTLKRVKNEPYLRASATGVLYVYFHHKEASRTLLKSTHTRDVNEAHRIALEMILEFKARHGVFGKETRFKDIATEILEKYKSNPQRRTYQVSLAPINRLCETFENAALISMTPSDWEKHLIRMRTERPDLNLNNDRKLFIQVMRRAFQKGLVKLPPVGIARPNSYQHVGREISKEEEKRILDSAVTPTFKFQIFLTIQTGMRLQEMLRLKWIQIDLTNGLVRLGSETKTSRPRVFAISDSIKSHLRKIKSDSPYVFPSVTDPNKPARDIKFLWRKTLKSANVKCRFHDLRHTCASRKVRAGIPVEIVAKELGMSVQVLQRIYLHINQDDLRRSAQAVAEIFEE